MWKEITLRLREGRIIGFHPLIISSFYFVRKKCCLWWQECSILSCSAHFAALIRATFEQEKGIIWFNHQHAHVVPLFLAAPQGRTVFCIMFHSTALFLLMCTYLSLQTGAFINARVPFREFSVYQSQRININYKSSVTQNVASLCLLIFRRRLTGRLLLSRRQDFELGSWPGPSCLQEHQSQPRSCTSAGPAALRSADPSGFLYFKWIKVNDSFCGLVIGKRLSLSYMLIPEKFTTLVFPEQYCFKLDNF